MVYCKCQRKALMKKAIIAAALAVSSMAVSAIWLDHTSGSAGSIECHGYLYSYSSTKFGADTTASATPLRVSVNLKLNDSKKSEDFDIYYNEWNSATQSFKTNHTNASVTVQGQADATGGTAYHVVVARGGATFDQATSH